MTPTISGNEIVGVFLWTKAEGAPLRSGIDNYDESNSF